MKASEIIKALERVIEDKGDIEVQAYSLHTGTLYEVERVQEERGELMIE